MGAARRAGRTLTPMALPPGPGAPSPFPEVLAAIDIGTNSVHMIVVQVRADFSFEVIDREKEMVRLGAGKGEMKHLEEDARQPGRHGVRRGHLRRARGAQLE